MNMMAFVFIFYLTILLAIIIPVAVIAMVLSDRQQQIDNMSDNTISNNEFMFVPYRGEVLTMRKEEYDNLWMHMDRQQRSEHLQAVRRAVKKGVIRQVYHNGNTYYVPGDMSESRQIALLAHHYQENQERQEFTRVGMFHFINRAIQKIKYFFTKNPNHEHQKS